MASVQVLNAGALTNLSSYLPLFNWTCHDNLNICSLEYSDLLKQFGKKITVYVSENEFVSIENTLI